MSDDDVSGTRAEIERATRGVVRSTKRLLASTYPFLFDRRPWIRAVLSVVLFVLGTVIGPVVQTFVRALIATLPTAAVLASPLLTAVFRVYTAVMLIALFLYNAHRSNTVERSRDDMDTTEPHTDGGRESSDHEEMLGTGEGALVGAFVGLCTGAFLGVTFGQSGIVWGVVGAVNGSFLFDAVERRAKRVTTGN